MEQSYSIAVLGVSVLSQVRLFALSYEERSRLNTVFVVNNFLFGAIGSAIVSLLWANGGWFYVVGGLILISVLALMLWLFSRKSFQMADN